MLLTKLFQLQLVFQAEKGRKDDYRMAIDDIIIKNSACGAPANCDFNNDYCSYFLNDTSDFAWLLGTGRVVNTQLIDNSPVDNSVENGKYSIENWFYMHSETSSRDHLSYTINFCYGILFHSQIHITPFHATSA